MAKPALGRGLGALLAGNPAAMPKGPATSSAAESRGLEQPSEPSGHARTVPVQKIRPCAFQPRKDFSSEGLRELAESIRAQGIVQPLVVRESNGNFEIIAGERRWRAAQLAGLTEVPVILRQASDREVLEVALIENLQRENLNPLEEALGYSALIEQFKLTQEEAAAKVGKSRAGVANALRLLKLPASIQENLRKGFLSVGHAKVLLGIDNSERQWQIAQKIVSGGLSVRQTEALIHEPVRSGTPTTTETGRAPQPDLHIQNLETKLREKFGTRVALNYKQGKGLLQISFFSDQELQRILDLVGVAVE
jgi:ParB family chromosome partitioning protein